MEYNHSLIHSLRIFALSASSSWRKQCFLFFFKDFPPATDQRLPLLRALSWVPRGPRRVPLRLGLQKDLCLLNGLRQWSDENTMEKDQKKRERVGEKQRNWDSEDEIGWKKFNFEWKSGRGGAEGFVGWRNLWPNQVIVPTGLLDEGKGQGLCHPQKSRHSSDWEKKNRKKWEGDEERDKREMRSGKVVTLLFGQHRWISYREWLWKVEWKNL